MGEAIFSEALVSGFRESLSRSGCRLGEDRLALFISGGADSTLLFHLARTAVPPEKLFAVVFDFGLRGEESRADADFAIDLARRAGVEGRRIDLIEAPSGNIQAWARSHRLAAGRDLLRSGRIDWCLTAHQADDRLESLLARLGTSASPGSLLSPRERRGRWLRPLLGFRKSFLRAELERNGLAWREDSSNLQGDYLRNRHRRSSLVALEAAQPGWGDGALRSLALWEDLFHFQGEAQSASPFLRGFRNAVVFSPRFRELSARSRRALLVPSLHRLLPSRRFTEGAIHEIDRRVTKGEQGPVLRHEGRTLSVAHDLLLVGENPSSPKRGIDDLPEERLSPTESSTRYEWVQEGAELRVPEDARSFAFRPPREAERIAWHDRGAFDVKDFLAGQPVPAPWRRECLVVETAGRPIALWIPDSPARRTWRRFHGRKGPWIWSEPGPLATCGWKRRKFR